MISNLVSSILNPAALAGAADKSASHQLDEDKNKQLPIASLAARPAVAHRDRISVHQSGADERIDYFHSAKNMLRDALSDFAGGVRASLADIGLEDGLAENFAKAVLHQTKDALLWGVGFSVKVMTATVSATSDSGDGLGKQSFSIMAKSIEISVNHADGAIDVSSDSVSIESHTVPGLGIPQPRLLDISDSVGQPSTGLASALQALQDPKSLLTNLGDDLESEEKPRLETRLAPERQDEIERTLPNVDTPRVLSRPDYNSRILLSEMNHFRNERNELVTYMRFDALIPLTSKPDDAPSNTPPARLATI